MTTKYLSHKNYGSIPHISASKLGPGDHKCSKGQERIALEKPRDKHDKIIVTEKLDGSNCGILRIGNELIALTRGGYLAKDSNFPHHLEFYNFVETNSGRFRKIINDGERLIGEWLSHAHGTIYNLPHEPWVVFDIMIGQKRLLYEEVAVRAAIINLHMPHVLAAREINLENSLKILGQHGFHGADLAEGVVWRVERKDKFDFMVKYVRPEKSVGIYLKQNIRNMYV